MSIEACIYDTDEVKTADKIRVFTVDELAAVPAMTEADHVPLFLTERFNLPNTATFTAEVDRNAMLSIFHGHKVTNNWLKYHGGVMSRKIHRRYRRER